jgi:DNA transposition AAA+ family ATPase
MNQMTSPHKMPEVAASGGQSFAPLKNVVTMMGLVSALISRASNMPGLGAFYGYSGFGKTMAAIYAQNKHRGALRVEIGDSWTKKTLLRALLRESGIMEPRGTVADMAELLIGRLAEPNHPPVFIDEADRLVDKGMIELVREIHEGSQVPIVLIGEEALPAKLAKSERTHNRVLEWAMAEPCDLDDARKLAAIVAPNVRIADDLVDHIRHVSDGRARRIVVNLHKAAAWAVVNGLPTLDRASYAGAYYTGSAPLRRQGAR